MLTCWAQLKSSGEVNGYYNCRWSFSSITALIIALVGVREPFIKHQFVNYMSDAKEKIMVGGIFESVTWHIEKSAATNTCWFLIVYLKR